MAMYTPFQFNCPFSFLMLYSDESDSANEKNERMYICRSIRRRKRVNEVQFHVLRRTPSRIHSSFASKHKNGT